MANKKKKVTKQTRAKLRKASKLYQKVRKNTAKELERRGQPLKGKDLTKFVREKIYLEFKGLSVNEVRVQDIYDSVEQAITGTGVLQTGEFFNPLAIPETLISGVFWFDIDNFIEVDLTSETSGKNLRLEVNAGDLGSTGIFELSNYSYEGSGLSEIIERVREEVDDDSEPYWDGEPRVRMNMKDDGNPDSYFLQFTLYIGGEQVKPTETFEEPQPLTLVEESIEERRKKRREVVKRRKELAKQRREKMKKKEMRGRKRPTKKEVTEVPKEAKVVPFDEGRAKNIQEALNRQERLLKDAKDLFDAGVFTKKEFIAERKQIIDQTNKAIDRFKKGGEIK